MTASVTYQSAGVNIAAGNEAVHRIKYAVESTFSDAVLTKLGSFGALYDLGPLLKTYEHPVLVQSIDGVGTKMMIANKMQKFDTIGIDLVSATANDIIVLGAKPITLLDYIANDYLNPSIIEIIIQGMVSACIQNDIALVGGEMAEMPGTYVKGEHDLVGVITGVVEKEKAILGKNIEIDDVILAFPSNGLHTNGYSLARKIFFELANYSVDQYFPELNTSLGEALLAPHINYTQPVLSLLSQGVNIKGMAHITGGGVIENIPRILPPGVAAEVKKSACPILPIFHLLKELGNLSEQELYRTFNMGIGFTMIVPKQSVEPIRRVLLQYFPAYPVYEIGYIVPGNQQVRLI
jgi:phosphoribosylformylglycinamidine cyclo-ligase